MAGKFVVKKGSTGQYRFNLVAGNGEIIATSESYTTKAAALKGTEEILDSASLFLFPWQAGQKDHFVRITPDSVTGRPVSAAVMKRGITAAYSDIGSWRGPKTLK